MRMRRAADLKMDVRQVKMYAAEKREEAQDKTERKADEIKLGPAHAV
jgi:hypothetical protein